MVPLLLIFFDVAILPLLLFSDVINKISLLAQGLVKRSLIVTASLGNNKIKNEGGSKDDRKITNRKV